MARTVICNSCGKATYANEDICYQCFEPMSKEGATRHKERTRRTEEAAIAKEQIRQAKESPPSILGAEVQEGVGIGTKLALAWCVGFIIYVIVGDPFGYRIRGSEWAIAVMGLLVPACAFYFIGHQIRQSPHSKAITNHVVSSASGAVENWSIQTQEKELQKFVDLISAMDGEEIGLSVAAVVDFRNRLLKDEGIDLYQPATILVLHPGFIFELSRQVAPLQKAGNNTAALPLIVWVHSLRAINTLELRMLGRNMWEQLERGFKYVEDATENASVFAGVKLDITDAGQFPLGLTPKPLD